MINVISSVRFNPDEIYPGISESAQPAIIAPNIGIIPNATNVLTFFFNYKYVIKTIIAKPTKAKYVIYYSHSN